MFTNAAESDTAPLPTTVSIWMKALLAPGPLPVPHRLTSSPLPPFPGGRSIPAGGGVTPENKGQHQPPTKGQNICPLRMNYFR